MHDPTRELADHALHDALFMGPSTEHPTELQRQVDALLSHARSVNSRLQHADHAIEALGVKIDQHVSASDTRSRHIELRIETLAAGQNAIQSDVRENTQLTREIRDALNAGKWITRALRWAGGIAVAIVGLWSLYAAVKAGVPVPPTPGVGP